MKYDLVHWIGGNDVTSSRILERRAPATGELISRTCTGGKDEVVLAVAAARKASKVWAKTPLQERCKIVVSMADWLADQYGEAGQPTRLKNLISLEVGKPLPEADIEVIETSDFIRYFGTNTAESFTAQQLVLDQTLWPTKKSVVQFEPRGVVGIIKPWNYPLEMIAWSLAPALVAGNTVIVKPSERSPVTASVFREMATAVGLPAGVINIVYGDAATGVALAEAEDVDYISFTGSTKAGRDLAMRSASKLRPCALEMGGNDAAIVLSDVSVELAANGLAWGAFANAGQVCVGTKRAYVEKSIYNALCSAVAKIAKELRIGTDIGPIIDESQLASIQQFVDDAVKKGARVLAGGNRIAHSNGTYFAPTVLADVPFSARLLSEECFGPVLPIMSFDSVADAVDRTNATTYGLGASIWTSDLERGRTIAQELQAGMIWVNDVNVAFPQAPWGGIKRSGIGFELSMDVLREYSIRKHVSVETSNETRRIWWYPY